VLLLALGIAPPELLSQSSKTAVPEQALAAQKQAPEEEFGPLEYRLLGPAWGGRVSRVAGIPGNPKVYYTATASGGVWKSADGGYKWEPVFDEQPISSMGSIAVSASDPNVVYAGSGEANIRGNVAAGNGIYKSVDAGKTWTHVWKQEGQIGTMAVHPANPDVAFAAVLGHAFGPNPERGVYRTRDGGKTWQQVLRKNADTGASDVALDPSNPSIVFAGLWQARRRPWELTSGGPGSGLYVSRDGGDTWKQLQGDGLPEGIWGKVGVAVAPSDGRRVYALIEAEEGGLFRSDDGGESWERVSGNRELRQRAWYYTVLTVSPVNPDEVWVPNVPLLKSIDGGRTFKHVQGLPHGDYHDLWIDPKDPKRIVAGDDGGVHLTLDGGESWFSPPLPIGQFYHVSVDNRVPFHVAGSMQDIGTAQGPSNSLSGTGVRNTDWYGVGGGEAGWVVSDWSDPNIVYAGEYGGIFTRYDHRTRSARNVSAWPDNPSGHGGEDLRYRFQWTAPIVVSPHDAKVVYHAANVLFRTDDGGQTWKAISPDLTRNDKSKQKWSGGPITGDNTGVETYCTIFAVAESPLQEGLIWAGSDDGRVHVTRDGGANWTEVTGNLPGIPEWGTVSMIEASRHDAGTAYLVVDNHRMDDMRPYLWRTTDFGRTWKRLDNGLAKDVYLHAVREDPVRKDLLYLGTERGVSYSRDGGASWRPLKLNLPTVAVHDLAVKDNSLVVGTHGRSVWIFDDLSVLREMTPDHRKVAAHLFAAPQAVRWSTHGAWDGQWSGQNPPRGASLYYWLKDEPKGDLTLEILDAQGRVVRKMSSKPAEPVRWSEYVEEEKEALAELALPKEPGVQRVVWDLAYDGPEAIPGGMVDLGDPTSGPSALPGTYTARLTVDGKTLTTPVQVVQDPRFQVAEADLAEQLRFSLEVQDAISRTTRAVTRLRTLRKQLADRNELLQSDGKAKAWIDGSKAVIAKLDQLEGELHNPEAEIVYDILAMPGGTELYSRLIFVSETVRGGDGAPTQGAREMFAELNRELAGHEAALQDLVANDLVSLNQQARQLDLPPVYVPTAR
ncbi:MAG TPA: glycosyl hydrolase, partial [Thermoanaerobaculia bacterium]|nr:glycosyl hydrolase [Thermoanaerobaculia bacterium]